MPLLDLLKKYNDPTDALGVFEDPGLDDFVFSWDEHGFIRPFD